MTVDISDLEPGDEVTVRGTFDRSTTGPIVRIGTGSVRLHPHQVVSVEPRPPRAGDRVRIADHDHRFMQGPFEVLAVAGTVAWLRDEVTGSRTEAALSSLIRLPKAAAPTTEDKP